MQNFGLPSQASIFGTSVLSAPQNQTPQGSFLQVQAQAPAHQTIMLPVHPDQIHQQLPGQTFLQMPQGQYFVQIPLNNSFDNS